MVVRASATPEQPSRFKFEVQHRERPAISLKLAPTAAQHGIEADKLCFGVARGSVVPCGFTAGCCSVVVTACSLTPIRWAASAAHHMDACILKRFLEMHSSAIELHFIAQLRSLTTRSRVA
jgi:hypothetical protein